MSVAVSAFLGGHGFAEHIDVEAVARGLLFDMDEALCGRAADQDMIRTWTRPASGVAAGKSVIVIDAGGTNFRSCLVRFDKGGCAEISMLEKTRMPGSERELGKREFFDKIADNIDRLKDKASAIGFCFSYPMKITADGDGVLTGFSKEVRAPEVVGSAIGKTLKARLVARGWKKIKRIALLNDTMAALLSGVASAPAGKSYSSYVGFILGTGQNAAYIQPPLKSVKGFSKPEIIVCESGKFSRIPRSSFDVELDKSSVMVGKFLLEKASSGAYLGPLALNALKAAAKEGFVSSSLAKKILGLKSLSLIEMDEFLHEPCGGGLLASMFAPRIGGGSNGGTDADREFVFGVLDAIAERSARLSAAILVANVLKSGAGLDASKPVCIVCNGSTFHKTYKLRSRVEGYLERILTEQRGIAWEAVSVDNDIVLGSAIAGLMRRC